MNYDSNFQLAKKLRAYATALEDVLQKTDAARTLRFAANALETAAEEEEQRKRYDKSLSENGIATLDLLPRTYNALMRAKVSTVEELVKLTPQDILDMKHVGKDTLAEIRRKLKRNGLQLKDDEWEMSSK